MLKSMMYGHVMYTNVDTLRHPTHPQRSPNIPSKMTRCWYDVQVGDVWACTWMLIPHPTPDPTFVGLYKIRLHIRAFTFGMFSLCSLLAVCLCMCRCIGIQCSATWHDEMHLDVIQCFHEHTIQQYTPYVYTLLRFIYAYAHIYICLYLFMFGEVQLTP